MAHQTIRHPRHQIRTALAAWRPARENYSPISQWVHRPAGALGPGQEIAVTPHRAHPQLLQRTREVVGSRQLRHALTTQPAQQLCDLRSSHQLDLHRPECRRLPIRHLPIRHLPNRHVPNRLGICLAARIAVQVLS